MFASKHIIITGGSSGAGKALAQCFLARGAKITLVARNREKLEAVRHALGETAAPEQIDVEGCDVSDPGAVERSFANLADRSGPADMLVNSAGILKEGRFEEQPLEHYRAVMDTNFFGTLHCSRAVVPQLAAQDGGRIVNIASLAGLVCVIGYAPYCAAKHALVGLSETMRMELAPRGIRVHLVCPPEFESPMVEELERYRSPENRAVVRQLGVMSMEQLVRETVHGLERGRFLIVPGRGARMVAGMTRHFPRLARWVVDRQLAQARRIGARAEK
jgi:3-dehydrosphinganine reductase